MPQPPTSHSPLQTAFGFVAIALRVVVTGFGPRLTPHTDSDSARDSLTPEAAVTSGTPSHARHAETTHPANAPADAPETPVKRR